MLVIISDLHLNDGTTGQTLDSGAFRIFAERLQDAAVRASWRSDDRYRPIESIDLVLLGDVLDLIRSNRWHADQTRPWHAANSTALTSRVSEITQATLQNNIESIAILNALADGQVIRVPLANAQGKPEYDAPLMPVEIRLHYMVGNHDWFLHQSGAAYDAIRLQVKQALGLTTHSTQPFPHEPSECPHLQKALSDHRVCARHGDIFDPINFTGNRDESSLGDMIVIELVNRFIDEVHQKLADVLPQTTLLGLEEIDNIRPLLLIPAWIDGLLERTCPQRSLHREIKSIWDQAADRFLQLSAVRQQDSWHPFEVVDGLEQLLKFSKRLSLNWSSQITQWLYSIRGAKNASYLKHALAEPEFRNRKAKHLVYGHTHVHESIPLDASYTSGFVLNQTYFNSGTWRRVHLPTELAPAGQEFIPSEMMTYLSFYQGDERQGRPFETWTGMLGMMPSSVRRVRLDPSQNAINLNSNISASPAPPIKQPHFLNPTTPTNQTTPHLHQDN